jgi:hypothetical protein
MHGRKKKLIEELETELEQLIANSGQSEVDIRTNYNAYYALKKRIDNPDSCHDNDNIQRMKDLHNVYLLGMSNRNRQKKINAARKVATAAATAATTAAAAIATSNVTNTSILSSASTSINGNKITASFESTPPPSSNPSTTSSLSSSNDKTRDQS